MTEKNMPNIFFLLIDSLRSDKCYGNDKTSITPNLDNLIKNGTIFTKAISSAPVTIPAISSILTGEYPSKSIIRGGNRAKLNPNIFNFVSYFKNLNYYTTAIVPKLLSLSGLTNNFDNVLEYEGHAGLYDGVGDMIMSTLLDKNLKNPWFFYSHILDIHGTARGFPKNFDEPKFGYNQYERMISAIDVWLGKFFNNIDRKETLIIVTGDHSTDSGIYSPDIEFTKNDVNHGNLVKSFKFGKKISSRFPTPLKSKIKKIYLNQKNEIKNNKKNQILEKINEKNLRPYQKRILLHSIQPRYDVFDDRFIVPFVLNGYGVKNNIIHQQIRTIDFFPTIVDILNIHQEDIVEGKSVLPLINGEELEEAPAYMESIANWNDSDKITNVIGIRYKNFKYFRSKNNPSDNIGFYDLTNDPYEENNLAKNKDSRMNEMEKILNEIENKMNQKSVVEINELRDLNEEKLVEAELRKLGYL